MRSLYIQLLGIKHERNISKEEIIILEILLHIHLCDQLNLYFTKSNDWSPANEAEKEGVMVDGSIVRKLANDLIVRGEYSVAGLANYSGFPEEVIFDLIAGINSNPTLELANKIIELHIGSRRELYLSILKNTLILR